MPFFSSPTPWAERWWTNQFSAEVTDQAAAVQFIQDKLRDPSSPINQPGYSESDDTNGVGVLMPAGLWDEFFEAWKWRNEHEQNGQCVP